MASGISLAGPRTQCCLIFIIIIYLLFFTTRNVAGNRLVCISAMPCCNELQFCRYSVQLWGLAGNLHGSFSMSPQDMSYQRQNQLSPSERRDTGRTPLEFPKNHAVTACDTAESIFASRYTQSTRLMSPTHIAVSGRGKPQRWDHFSRPCRCLHAYIWQ